MLMRHGIDPSPMPSGHLVLGAMGVMRQNQRMLSLLERTLEMPEHFPDQETEAPRKRGHWVYEWVDLGRKCS